MRHGRNRNEENVQRARTFRKSMGKSERLLWYELRVAKLGFRFRRQHPFGPYFLDFYCPEAALCVEVDGDQHEHQVAHDARRDAYLLQHDIETYRVPSDSLYVAMGEILYKIRLKCEERTGRSGTDPFEWLPTEPPPGLPLPARAIQQGEET
jgi:very-short-patch-repair endonuclease